MKFQNTTNIEPGIEFSMEKFEPVSTNVKHNNSIRPSEINEKAFFIACNGPECCSTSTPWALTAGRRRISSAIPTKLTQVSTIRISVLVDRSISVLPWKTKNMNVFPTSWLKCAEKTRVKMAVALFSRFDIFLPALKHGPKNSGITTDRQVVGVLR